MTDKTEFLIETDILADHLSSDNNSEDTVLETAMQRGTCFTTVLNASELYFAASTEEENIAVDKLLKALKILGLNSRYSLSIFGLNRTLKNIRDSLIYVTAKINKLPIITADIKKYGKTDIKIIHPKELRG